MVHYWCSDKFIELADRRSPMVVGPLCGLRRLGVVPLSWQRLVLFGMAYQVVARQKPDVTADFVDGVFDTIMRDVGLLELTSTIHRQVVEPQAVPTLPPLALDGLWPLSLSPKRRT